MDADVTDYKDHPDVVVLSERNRLGTNDDNEVKKDMPTWETNRQGVVIALAAKSVTNVGGNGGGLTNANERDYICARLISGTMSILQFHVSEPCPDTNCQDSFCMLCLVCKCSKEHKTAGHVFPSICFPVNKNGNRLKSCLAQTIRNAKRDQFLREDLLSFLNIKAVSFRRCDTHRWCAKPSTLQALVFIRELADWYIRNPDTPFEVSSTTFSRL